MNIIRADHMGMCFGVRDAIALAKKESNSGSLSILGDLVHNEQVLAELRARGVEIRQDARAVTTEKVLITAHGASEQSITATRQLGLKVIEATCPLVHFAHRAVKTLVAEGYHPVIIGKRGHVEVRGMTEDLPEHDVVLTEQEIDSLREQSRFGVVAQTTQPIERVQALTAHLRRRFPNSTVKFIDTVCQPTKQRQAAVLKLAQASNIVLVIGGVNSNNTIELVKTSLEHCPRVYHVQTAAGLKREWFQEMDTVGITAGTSTPDTAIKEVERRLQQWAAEMTVLAPLESCPV